MTKAERIEAVIAAHARATSTRRVADHASEVVKREIAQALDSGVLAPELATELGLSVVRIYQLARQGRALLEAEERE